MQKQKNRGQARYRYRYRYRNRNRYGLPTTHPYNNLTPNRLRISITSCLALGPFAHANAHRLSFLAYPQTGTRVLNGQKNAPAHEAPGRH